MHHLTGRPNFGRISSDYEGKEVKVQQFGRIGVLLVALGAVLILALASCGEGSESGEHSSGSESGEHSGEAQSGEHDEGSESGEGDGEESSAQFSLNDTFDQVRAGARLVLSYDSTANAFTGTVENTTENTLPRVRVEVHLSNGIELGPTEPVDLAPGHVADVTLQASSQPFTTWSAHPEVG